LKCIPPSFLEAALVETRHKTNARRSRLARRMRISRSLLRGFLTGEIELSPQTWRIVLLTLRLPPDWTPPSPEAPRDL